jgi:hypothetical protein
MGSDPQNKQYHKTAISPLVLLSFCLCLTYWFFLACTAEMVIAHDSVGYEQLGTLLSTNGWSAYFHSGPNREPLYPFLISLSMRLGNVFSLSYQTFQILIQVTILFVSQLLMLKILQKMGIQPLLCALAILYFGISSSVINSAFRLYSEVATYPLMLGLILATSHLWQSLLTNDPLDAPSSARLFGLSSLVAIFFVLLALVKGIFELIMIPFFLPFLILIIYSLKTHDRIRLKKSLAAFFYCLLIILGMINSYKLLNKSFNGNFTLTDRGPWALYGNTARRMEPLDAKRLAAALASIPGWRACTSIFDQDTCAFWSYGQSDEFGAAKKSELRKQNLSEGQINKQLILLSLQKALHHPLQYILLWVVEGLKLFFWESPTMAYVFYPEAIIKIYKIKMINLGLSTVMPTLTILSMLYINVVILKRRRQLFSEDLPLITLWFIDILLIGYFMSHAVFYIDPRYSFPLIPLYLIVIAFTLQDVSQRFDRRTRT